MNAFLKTAIMSRIVSTSNLLSMSNYLGKFVFTFKCASNTQSLLFNTAVFMINSTSYIKSNLILDVLHNLHVMRFDLQSDKNTPHRDIDQGAAPTDDFQGHGLQDLFNQCPDNIGKADVFETNYRWEHLI